MTAQVQENHKTNEGLEKAVSRYSPYMGWGQENARAGETIEIEQVGTGGTWGPCFKIRSKSGYRPWACQVRWITQYQKQWIVVLWCFEENETDHMTIMKVTDSKRHLALFKEEDFPAVAEFVEKHMYELRKNTSYEVAEKQVEQSVKSALNLETKTDWYGPSWKSYDNRIKEQEYLKKPRWVRELMEIGTLMITMWFPQN